MASKRGVGAYCRMIDMANFDSAVALYRVFVVGQEEEEVHK